MPACYKKRGRVDPAARSQMDGRAPAGGLGVGGLGGGVPGVGQDVHRGQDAGDASEGDGTGSTASTYAGDESTVSSGSIAPEVDELSEGTQSGIGFDSE
jgi:hypothetical protein